MRPTLSAAVTSAAITLALAVPAAAQTALPVDCANPPRPLPADPVYAAAAKTKLSVDFFTHGYGYPGCDLPGDVLEATVDWGDGETSAATVTADGSSWELVADHVYEETGRYTGSIAVRNTRSGIVQTYGFTTQVGPSGKRTFERPLRARSGARFDGTLAALRVPGVHRLPKDYAATVDWGDGSKSKGKVTFARGRFAVAGRHTYRRPGNQRLRITISDGVTGAVLELRRTVRVRG